MTIMCRKTFFSIAIIAFLAGCSSSDRGALRGTVTLDNQPLQKGSIRFIPMQGTDGPSAGGMIENGTFEVDSSKGVLPGSFRVEVTASKATGRRTRDRISGEMTDVYAQFLPARYNSRSELTAKVEASGVNEFEFALTTQP